MLFSANALQDIQLSELTETQSITKERGTISKGLSMTGGDPPRASQSTLASRDPPCASQSVLTFKPQAGNIAPDDFVFHQHNLVIHPQCSLIFSLIWRDVPTGEMFLLW